MNKQSNKKFNDLIKYIEDNLCGEISYKKNVSNTECK